MTDDETKKESGEGTATVGTKGRRIDCPRGRRVERRGGQWERTRAQEMKVDEQARNVGVGSGGVREGGNGEFGMEDCVDERENE